MNWSRLGFERVSTGNVLLPEDAGLCYAVHVDDVAGLLLHLANVRSVPTGCVWAVNPETLTWEDYYGEHCRQLGLDRSRVQRRPCSEINRLSGQTQPSFLREVGGWLYHSPLMPKILRRSRIASSVYQRYAYVIEEPAFAPGQCEMEMYRSDAEFREEHVGGATGYTYSIPFRDGVAQTRGWWDPVPDVENAVGQEGRPTAS